MKRIAWLCLLICVVLWASSEAEQARDLTLEASIQIKNGGYSKRFAWDRNVDTGTKLENAIDPWILIELPEDITCSAVYLEFGNTVLPFSVQCEMDGVWTEMVSWEEEYAQAYVAFPPQNRVKLFFHTKGRYVDFDIREIFVFSEGEQDEEIAHIWQPQSEKVDLLVLVAHPDDELLWLGGTLPYYAGEKRMEVAVAYLTCSKYTRRLELLNGLWHCGVHSYPIIGGFQDIKSYSRYDLYSKWGGKNEIDLFVTRVLRQMKPEVVVTQAMDGEYGHAAHMICADTLMRAVELAADVSYDASSANQFGTWQVKKLYVHKTVEGKPLLFMNWREPLSAFDGKSSFEIAEEAYKMHASQPQVPVKNGKAFFYVVPENEENSSFVFTLVHSTVGADEANDDMFEHIK